MVLDPELAIAAVVVSTQSSRLADKQPHRLHQHRCVSAITSSGKCIPHDQANFERLKRHPIRVGLRCRQPSMQAHSPCLPDIPGLPDRNSVEEWLSLCEVPRRSRVSAGHINYGILIGSSL
jgi:hypothetical protein